MLRAVSQFVQTKALPGQPGLPVHIRWAEPLEYVRVTSPQGEWILSAADIDAVNMAGGLRRAAPRQPGAVRPYFIRDANYGYGFDDVGRLVIIYDLMGHIMPQSFLYEREPYVSRYYQRADMLTSYRDLYNSLVQTWPALAGSCSV